MGMRLLLVASIVSSGLVFVQPRNDVGNDPHEVRENFRNLFNSINKNDLRKTGTYRNALELDAVRERLDFDSMKETWRSKRQRNADEHRDIRERRSAFKREAETTAALEPSSESPETPATCSTSPEPSEQSGTSPLDEQPSEQSTTSPLDEQPSEQSTTSPQDEKSTDAPSSSTEPTIPTRRSTISYELASFITSTVSKPPSPKPTHENCADLKTAIWTYDMKSFVNIVDRVYAKLFRHPQSNQGSLDVLNHILTSCNMHTKKLDEIRRRDHREEFSNGTEAAGVVDIRTVDQKGGNLVVKIKFNRDSCVALGRLLNVLALNEFNSLYPKEKISLLAMTFNKDDEGPVVREWIALFAQDGEIVGKGAQSKAACLKADEYKNMTYKEKPILEYFENLN